MKKTIKIQYLNYVFTESKIENKFYFYKIDNSIINEDIEAIVDICYNKYLLEKIKNNEIIDYEVQEKKINITLDASQEIAQVEISGIKIEKEIAPVKTKNRFRY